MIYRKGITLVEILIAASLCAFMLVSINKLAGNLNNTLKKTDKNSVAIFMIESIKNKVKADLSSGMVTYDAINPDITQFTNSKDWHIKVIKREQNGVKLVLFNKDLYSGLVYEFGVFENE
ncbi:MAG: hypothetical protein PHF29_00545 [Candidatus Riflebacteria bacterium]|nr:hypothetical protein [Candidatus Riflebacteria bacterium]MDD3000226.1 hypothetical protein [Candidatus Riflebacteria bacterium]